VSVRVNGELILSNTTSTLRDLWEETSFQLEKLQANPASVVNEQRLLKFRQAPSYFISFDPETIFSCSILPRSAGCGCIFFCEFYLSTLSRLRSFGSVRCVDPKGRIVSCVGF